MAKVNRKNFDKFLKRFNTNHIKILKDKWNKSGSVIIRRLEWNGVVIAFMVNWKTYYIFPEKVLDIIGVKDGIC